MSWICPICETENSDKLKVCEVCKSPRTKTAVDVLKEELKKRYSENAYSTFIRYHYDLLDSADKGNITSMYQVAEWFWKHGNTDDKLDYLMIAVVWYRKAARDGHRAAQFKLASCYEEGIGIQKRKEEAIKWYKEASKDGDENALRKYLVLKYDEDAYRQAINYNTSLLANADKGNLKSQYELGEWFRYRSKTQYKKEALVWYTKAANNGHSKSMFALAECLEYGYFSPVNKTAALHWYIKAANSGHKGARLRLIQAYLNGGAIVNKNIEETLSWYRIVGEGLSAGDFCNIGYAYETGDGVAVDKEKAVKYYRIAADKGDETAQYNMGVCYENGNGITKDVNRAIYWYGKAASQGYSLAQECLDRINYQHHQEDQEEKGCLCHIIAIIIAVIGLLILLNASEDSWLHKKIYFNTENGVFLWIGATILSFYITKIIVGYENE